VCFKKRTFTENFFENALKIVLDRRDITQEYFNEVCERQLKKTNGVIDDEFMVVPRVLAELIAILSNSLRYKTDETYTSRKKLSREERHLVLEMFFDPYTYGSGDCEDDSSLEHDVFRKILRGMEQHANPNVIYKKNGGWRSKSMDLLQMLSSQYIGCGTLGIVTSRWVGENDGKTGRPKPIIIDSDEYKNAEEGGHMWYLLIPTPAFEGFVSNISIETIKIFKDGRIMPWAEALPILVCEGTGWMDPYLKPEVDYYKSVELKKRIEEELECKVNAMLEIAKKTKAIRKEEMQIFQMLAKPIEKCSLSMFYRFAICMTTDQLLREDFGAYKFLWVTDNSKKRSKTNDAIAGWFGEDDEDYSSHNWLIGANIRDIVYKSKNVGLFVLPSMHENEILAAKAKLRHFLPNRPIVLTNKEKIESEWNARLRGFKQNLEKIFKERNVSTSEVNKMLSEKSSFVAICRGESILSERKQKEILEDIVNFKHIKGCKIDVEVLTDITINVRLTFYCERVTKSYTNEEIKSMTGTGVEVIENVYEASKMISESKDCSEFVTVKVFSDDGEPKTLFYKFEDMEIKEDFIRSLLDGESNHIEGKTIDNVKVAIKKGVMLAKK
jgi:hypothetical protein